LTGLFLFAVIFFPPGIRTGTIPAIRL